MFIRDTFFLYNKLNGKLILSVLVVVSLLISCSFNKEPLEARLLEKELYDQAQIRLKNGNFSSAIISLETLEARFPFGRYAEQSQAELIFAYYKNFEFEAAMSSAERFINLHPRHPHTDYAYYLKGLAAFTDDSGLITRYFSSDLSKRDIEPAQKSFDYLSDFLSRFPESEYVSHAKKRMVYLRNLIARSEIGIANFYMERRAYVASIGRAKYVIEHLPNTPQNPYALSILVRAYDALGYEDLSLENKEILKLNYPNFSGLDDLNKTDKSWLSKLTFGILGEEEIPPPSN